MIWIASIAGGLVGLVVLMALVGLALPKGHVAVRRATFAKPPDDVWRGMTALVARPSKIRYEIVENRPNERLVNRIADDKLPFGGRWIFELQPEGSGTQLTITEDGFVTNPIFRFLSKIVFSHTATLEKFLVDLGAHLGAPAQLR
jgi:hypothetical protein